MLSPLRIMTCFLNSRLSRSSLSISRWYLCCRKSNMQELEMHWPLSSQNNSLIKIHWSWLNKNYFTYALHPYLSIGPCSKGTFGIIKCNLPLITKHKIPKYIDQLLKYTLPKSHICLIINPISPQILSMPPPPPHLQKIVPLKDLIKSTFSQIWKN